MKKVDLKNKTHTFGNVLLAAVKNRRVKKWFYEWQNGHPFLLNEEVDIICETRAEERYLWMNDRQIQELIRIRVKAMYKKKYPNSKRWSLAHF